MAHHGSATAQKRKRPETAEEETDGAGMCANGCGFFGAAATGNLCSKCYLQEHVASDATAEASVSIAPAAASSTAPPEKKAKMIAAPASSNDASASSAAVVGTPRTSLKQQQQASTVANRCATCRKKVGLLGFRCRCEGIFCSVHRYSDKHACGFDYKTAGRKKIAEHNPVVVADKIGTRI